jgi:hypothetical protein
VKFGLAHHGNQQVQGLFGYAVDLFDVEQSPLPKSTQQGTIYKSLGYVALGEHYRGIERANKASWCEFSIAFNKLKT